LPPAPVNVTATVSGHEVTITWDAPPGDSVWDDDDDVVAIVERIDCYGTTEVAVIQPGYSGSVVDRFAPLTQPTGTYCNEPDHTCSIQYRVRYRGVIVRTLDAPDLVVPDGLIIGWPESVASIPTHWSRVAALDDKYVKMVSTPATVPGTTGGSATHVHTTPGHVHSEDHYHTQGDTPGNGSCINMYSESSPTDTRPCNHHHHRPNTSTDAVNSGSASPALEAASSDLAHKAYVFIESDGVPAGIPTNGIALWNSATPPTGWDEENDDGADVADRPPFLHGATVGSDGSRNMTDYVTHDHGVASHTHAGTSHAHSSGNTTTATSYYWATPFTGGLSYYAAAGHTHSISIVAAATAALNAATGGTSDVDSTTVDNDPAWKAQTWIENTGAASLPLGTIGLWLSPLASIPATWQVCDGTNGTPNLSQGKFLRHRGNQAVGTEGGGTGHTHDTPEHGHTTGGHAHTANFGASTSNTRGTTASVVSRATPGHTHGSAATDATTPAVGNAASGISGATLFDPPYVETTFVMLVSTDTSVLVEPYTTYSAWSDESPIVTIPNTSPALLWLRDPIDGEVVTCPTTSWGRERPFTATQPAEGGIPPIVTGDVGGRDYTLTIPCVDRTTRALVEDILAAPLFWCQPFDSPPIWLTVMSESAQQTTVKGISVITATCVAVSPEPLDDPEDLLP
jgi:hypothetical protein